MIPARNSDNIPTNKSVGMSYLHTDMLHVSSSMYRYLLVSLHYVCTICRKYAWHTVYLSVFVCIACMWPVCASIVGCSAVLLLLLLHLAAAALLLSCCCCSFAALQARSPSEIANSVDSCRISYFFWDFLGAFYRIWYKKQSCNKHYTVIIVSCNLKHYNAKAFLSHCFINLQHHRSSSDNSEPPLPS